jgi:subtilisin family serine protease
MKKFYTLVASILLTYNATAQLKNDFVSNQLILKFKTTEVSADDHLLQNNINRLKELNEDLDLDEIRLSGNRKEKLTFLLTYHSNHDIPLLVQQFEESGLFDYVEPNYIGAVTGQRVIPNDEESYKQWCLVNDGSIPITDSKVDADIDMDLAWDVEQGSDEIIVAVIDTGMKLDHPEIEGRNWINTADPVDGVDNDGNGYIDDEMGWDFQNDDNDPTDDNGHGTSVTGIIAANGNNGIGFAGVDWNCKVMHLKAMDDDGTGSYINWIDAIYYAVENGAKVINMSVGSSFNSTSLQTAVNYAHNNNVMVVASSGNSNDAILYPAAFAKALAVGSTDPEDLRSNPFPWSIGSGSCFGPNLDLVAPGSYIYSLIHDDDNIYNQYFSGTSQAAPHVSGVISLLFAQDPLRTSDDIEEILEASCEDMVGDPEEDEPGWDPFYGHGRLNAFLALNFNSLGIDETETGISFSLFPNPVKDLLHINCKGINHGTIEIKNSMGQSILKQEFESSSFHLNLPDLEAGMYLVSFSDDQSQLLSTQKIIFD